MEEIIKKLDKDLEILKYEYVDEDIMMIYVERKNKEAICPICGKSSKNINCKYTRTIKDLPIQENKVILKIIVKVFFCQNEKCSVKTFAENFDFIESHSRMTKRLKDRIINEAKGMSARAAKEVINKGVVNTSDDTILRLIKKNDKRI